MNPRQHERMIARLNVLPRRTMQLGAVGDRRVMVVVEFDEVKRVVEEELLENSATLELMLGIRELQRLGGEIRFPYPGGWPRYAAKLPDGPPIYGETLEEVLGIVARLSEKRPV